MEDLKRKAEAFTLSYKAAMELSLNPSTTRSECAEALGSHYKPGLVSFFSNNTSIMEKGAAPALIEQHLERFQQGRLGWKIHLAKHEIMPYSTTSAQCWLTWAIEPQNGIEAWQWTNIYGFRLSPDGQGKGMWEYIVSDHEIGELLKRVPDFFGIQ